MRVLIACEWSGTVRDAFRRRGHDAWSCDLLGPDDLPDEFRSQQFPNYHFEGDARDFLGLDWDMLIAHPPCDRLTNAGVRWLDERNLWAQLDIACALFRDFLNAKHIPRRAVENPIPHGYAIERVGRKYDQIIQPWQFGHGETKATCLWLHGLPKLASTHIVSGRAHKVHQMSPGPDRSRLRGRTYPGIADAMADQWGAYAT